MKQPVTNITTRWSLDADGNLFFRGEEATANYHVWRLNRHGESRLLTGERVQHYGINGSDIRLRRIRAADGSSTWDCGSASIPEVLASFRELEKAKAAGGVRAVGGQRHEQG